MDYIKKTITDLQGRGGKIKGYYKQRFLNEFLYENLNWV